MTDRTLTQLQTLLPPQFEEVVYRYGLPPAYTTGTRTQQAIDLLRYAEQREDLARLQGIICEVSGGPAPAPPLAFAALPADYPAPEAHIQVFVAEVIYQLATEFGFSPQVVVSLLARLRQLLEHTGVSYRKLRERITELLHSLQANPG